MAQQDNLFRHWLQRVLHYWHGTGAAACGAARDHDDRFKFEDRKRSVFVELGKSVLLRVFHGALVAGYRQIDYLHFLGFARRPIAIGYDSVSTQRVRDRVAAAGLALWLGTIARSCMSVAWWPRDLACLIDGYALYAHQAGSVARRLRLVRDGPLRAELEQQVAALGLVDQVEFSGFLQEAAVLEPCRVLWVCAWSAPRNSGAW
jgi:glycosyltransferase involved in cell wall biosynthesis